MKDDDKLPGGFGTGQLPTPPRLPAQDFRSLRETAVILKQAVEEILVTVEESAKSASTTERAVLNTTTTVERVKQTAQTSSRKAEEVSAIAQDTLSVSQRGTHATLLTVDSIQQLQTKINKVSDSVKQLALKNDNISETISMLTELTQQLNILAVNGAIEAAKSGESGIGFGAVAREMKALSVESGARTNKVREILYEVNNGIHDALKLMHEVSQTATQVLEQSNNAFIAISSLSHSVGESASAATVIAASGNEQLEGMEHVSASMEEIKEASRLSRISLERLERAALGVNEISERLHDFFQSHSSETARKPSDD